MRKNTFRLNKSLNRRGVKKKYSWYIYKINDLLDIFHRFEDLSLSWMFNKEIYVTETFPSCSEKRIIDRDYNISTIHNKHEEKRKEIEEQFKLHMWLHSNTLI